MTTTDRTAKKTETRKQGKSDAALPRKQIFFDWAAI